MIIPAIAAVVLLLLLGGRRKALAGSTTTTVAIADSDTVTWSVPLGDNVEQPSKNGQPIGSVRVTGTHAASKEWIADLQASRERTRLELAVGAGATTEAFIFVNDAVATECGQGEYDAWIKRIEGGGSAPSLVAVPLGELRAVTKQVGDARAAIRDYKVWRRRDFAAEALKNADRGGTRLSQVWVDAEYPQGSTEPSTGAFVPGNWYYPYRAEEDGGVTAASVDFKAMAAGIGQIAAGGAIGFVSGGPVGAFAGAALAGVRLAATAGPKAQAALDAVGMGAAALERYDACVASGGNDVTCSLEATGKADASVAGTLNVALGANA